MTPSDTIVAVATPPGRGGIAVVRLSGPEAFAIAQTLVQRPVTLTPRRAVLARIAVPTQQIGTSTQQTRPSHQENCPSNQEITKINEEIERSPSQAMTKVVLDEAVILPFAAPASYTGEPVVEISIHGSTAIAGAVVQAAVQAGARPAQAGEFTLRVFLNGRLDLAQAEAVRDLIEATTPLQARVAFVQLTGTLSGRLAEIERELFSLSARLEASIDFPDEGYRFVGPGEVETSLLGVGERVEALVEEGKQGRLVREGATVALVGRTNVGKSTLFNRLVGHDRAIVTAVPGTTRDLLTEVVTFDGLRVTLVDTAGVRESLDLVEREGVARADRARAAADLVVVVLDGSAPLEEEDLRLLEETADRPRVVVRNKADLPPAPWLSRLGLCVSGLNGDGVNDLIRSISQELGWSGAAEPPALSNPRHIELLGRVREALDVASQLLANAAAGDAVPEELILADLQRARAALEEVTGRRTTEELLSEIFSKFCVGK
ncbi:MAG: tRNA uridine-5-carboxymethylaminomethyl(34) synthesis GTPase MnmE [Acidobacteria bacterium]|nr:MAG: tRNA uridine-5-carboxymethylaminomethyl(34) synthesis GTPase MnmE [Acidobacteriota bacterium]